MEGVWEKAVGLVVAMSDDDLCRVWNAMRDYDPAEYYDAGHGVTMDERAHLIYQQMSSRGLPVM